MELRLGRCVLGCLLVLGLAGCTQEPRAAGSPPAPPPTSRTTGVVTTTTRDNVVATRRFSAWLLHAVPMPPGAREWHHSPTAHYRRGSVGIGPSDPELTRTTWWTVPLTSVAFGSWLRDHAPHGLRPESDTGGRPVESMGVWERDQDFRGAGTTAHTRGWVNFAFRPRGDGLVVRVDTFVGARFARTVLVPDDATSVRIVRTVRSSGPHPRPHTTVRTISDSRAVAELVGMVNALPGAMTKPFVVSCLASVTQQSYVMAFATPHGSYVASLPTSLCVPRVSLTHDGAGAGPPLDPGRLFARTADEHLG